MGGGTLGCGAGGVWWFMVLLVPYDAAGEGRGKRRKETTEKKKELCVSGIVRRTDIP